MTDTWNDTLHEFPCEFAIKAFGPQGQDFEQTVLEIVQDHAPEITAAQIRSRQSSSGSFISVTATITAQSKAQLDAIYQALTDHDQVLMSL